MSDLVKHQELPDPDTATEEQLDSYAGKYFPGTKFRDLEARDQRRVSKWMRAEAKDILEHIKSIQNNNLLEAERARFLMGQELMRLQQCTRGAINDAVNLYHEGDNMEVTHDPNNPKNASGSLRRKVRHLQSIARLMKTNAEVTRLLADTPKGATIIGKQQNTQLNAAGYTAQAVATVLGGVIGDSTRGGDGADEADAEDE